MEIKAEILCRMVQHAVLTRPYECCGMLISKGSVVDGIYPCENEAQSQTRFAIAPRQLFEFFRNVREQKANFAGIYHSHPDGDPIPSHRDIREFHYPEASYWIISLRRARPSVGCYRWDVDSGFVPIAFQIVSDRSRHYLTRFPDLSISKTLSGGTAL